MGLKEYGQLALGLLFGTACLMHIFGVARGSLTPTVINVFGATQVDIPQQGSSFELDVTAQQGETTGD